MGFWGTTEQETGVCAACWVANILPSAINRRILPNGRLHVRKSHLQNTKLLRQLLQSRVSKLLSYILLCLNRVFCSYTLQHPLWPSRSKWRIFYGKEERRQPPRDDHTPTMRSHKALRTISQGIAHVGCPSVPMLSSLYSIIFYSSNPLRQQQLELTENLRSDAPGGPGWPMPSSRP